MIEAWPENETALDLFGRVGTRWRCPPMGMVPMGLQWEAIYPLMDRLKLGDDEWNSLHDDLMLMEAEAIRTMHEFAPKSGA